MINASSLVYSWAIIGAGPAGLASAGLLVDAGVPASEIIIIDPEFSVGDFGKYWGEVFSNTTVELFMRFFTDIQCFNFIEKQKVFPIESLPLNGYCQLKAVREPLQWITNQLRERIDSLEGYASDLKVHHGAWSVRVANKTIRAKKVILATGGTPKSLSHQGVDEITLYDALNPSRLSQLVNPDDKVAVFGSSHSSMIIMKNLLDAGIKQIVNFYLTPHRYAVPMDGWTLYDNTGLKADTASWVRQHISQQLDPRIERYISNDNNINDYLYGCDKAVYPIGFKSRIPSIKDFGELHHDANTGIIAPGLFGAGIAFPRQVIDPFGGKELNVGLFKFMNDIRAMVPLWLEYGL